MASWTTTAKVARWLPSNYATYLTTTMADLITEASGVAEAHLSPRYWPFPDAGSTPDCPDVIQRLVALYAAHLARLELGRSNEMELITEGQSVNLLSLYYEEVGRLRTDDDERQSQVPGVRVSSETITLGTAPLNNDEYKFDPGGLGLSGFEVIQDSVRVSGYQLGEDFNVKFSRKDRAWLFVSYNSAITTGSSVSYDIDFLRRREITRPVTNIGGDLVR